MVFVEKVYREITYHNLLDDGDAVVVGVSGGPDSIALVTALAQLKKRKKIAFDIVVVHLNHKLRAEADEEEDFVKRCASKLGFPFFSKSIYLKKQPKRAQSLEERARNARYVFFEQVAQKCGASKIALGHNRDDNVETILMRIIRGTSLKGLAGIPLMRPVSKGSSVHIIRPLLAISRGEIEKYLRINHIEYRVDSSNKEPVYDRNRVRLELLPILKRDYNPKIADALLRLSFAAKNSMNFVEGLIEEAYSQVVTIEKNSVRIDISQLCNLPQAEVFLLFHKIFDEMGILDKITFAHFEQISNVLTKSGSSKRVELPGGYILCKEYDKITITHKKQVRRMKNWEYEVALPDTVELPDIRSKLIARIIDWKGKDTVKILAGKPGMQELLDYDTMKNKKLVIRNRRRGDFLTPLGMRGTRKLKDVFIDKKISLSKRGAIPLLACGSEIICAFGVLINDRFKITSSTRKVVELTVKPT